MVRNGLLFLIAVVGGPLASGSTAAKYDVRLISLSPPRLSVTATVPVAGDAIEMSTSRPGDVARLGQEGWPALVRNLRVEDEHGQTLALTSAGPKGWRLAAPHTGHLRVRYEVDYAILAEGNWPAQREAAFADDGHLVVVGRSLFITTPTTTVSMITIPVNAVAIALRASQLIRAA